MEKCAIIIPSLNPSPDFYDFALTLNPCEEMPLIVVNDGSKEECLDIFSKISQIPFCHVLTHSVNRGKGAALKTAFKYYKDNFSHLPGAVTADCDGQHSLEDILKVGNALIENPSSIILGYRDFSQSHVPFRSRFGNKLNTTVFSIIYGKKLPDTQTGLRAVPTALMDWALEIVGDRFDYEMSFLTIGARTGKSFVSVPIKTIYINENASSHYNVLRDSISVGKSLLGGLFSYSSSAFLSSFLDVGLFILLNTAILTALPLKERLFWATTIARATSSAVNYLMNRSVVFKTKDGYTRSLIRYYGLWSVQLLCSYWMTLWSTLWLDMNPNYTKLLIDLILAAGSYQVQMHWVFKNEK